MCVLKTKQKQGKGGVMFQTKVENGTIYKSDQYRFCVWSYGSLYVIGILLATYMRAGLA